MAISDRQITLARTVGDLGLHPFNPEQLSGASYDVRLGRNLLQLVPNAGAALDTAQPAQYEALTIPNEGLTLQPGELYLGVTHEWIKLPNNWIAKLEGVSSAGRIGIEVHCTAGFIDPGFFGHITLEIQVVKMTRVYPYSICGQLVFTPVVGSVERVYKASNGHSYNNEYMTNPSPMPSQYHKKVAAAQKYLIPNVE